MWLALPQAQQKSGAILVQGYLCRVQSSSAYANSQYYMSAGMSRMAPNGCSEEAASLHVGRSVMRKGAQKEAPSPRVGRMSRIVPHVEANVFPHHASGVCLIRSLAKPTE